MVDTVDTFAFTESAFFAHFTHVCVDVCVYICVIADLGRQFDEENQHPLVLCMRQLLARPSSRF